jgi:hypothetical protein
VHLIWINLVVCCLLNIYLNIYSCSLSASQHGDDKESSPTLDPDDSSSSEDDQPPSKVLKNNHLDVTAPRRSRRFVGK